MQKKKVLIIGATGMLGHMVHKYFTKLDTYELYNSVYRTPLNNQSIICNVKDQNAVATLFEQTKPDVVINCVGALTQESKTNPTSAIYLNALFPNILKDLCNKYQAKLIHVSTDCVFSGKKGAYSEEDFRDADDVYGRSKALGEIFDAPHCTLRTSIIGPELKDGTGLFHWFMKQEGEVRGFTNAYWSGVTTLELAKAIDKAISNDLKGLFHVTNGEVISKYDLLKLVKDIYKLKQISLFKYEIFKVDKSLNPSKRFDFCITNYRNMIRNMFEF
jgi:dTDP-4-dehydrorhamnose reductase